MQEVQAASPPLPPTKPRSLSTVVGLGIAVAALAAFSSLSGLAGSALVGKGGLFNPKPPPNLPSEQAERLKEIQGRMLEISRPTPAARLLYVATLGLAGWTFVTIHRMTRRRRGATTAFSWAMAIFAVVEVAYIGLQ